MSDRSPESRPADSQPAERLFSGIRPTGEPHIGNYLGALRNWVELQERYECLFAVVDLHALTTPFEPPEMPAKIMDMAAAVLACGVDPERSTFFVQSEVPEHSELAWMLNCITPLGALQRMTQFKDKSEQHSESVNAGLLSYPVLMAADILLYRAQHVPVGDDQLQHLELTREIARKFTNRYGELLPEPKAVLTKASRIMGLDGKAKMSKSLGNAVSIGDDGDAIRGLLRPAFTDPQRLRRADPGRPEVCNIYALHGHFTPADVVEDVAAQCRGGTRGCVDCKQILAEHMAQSLAPVRERWHDLRARPDDVREILREGARKARAIAADTLEQVRDRLGIGVPRE